MHSKQWRVSFAMSVACALWASSAVAAPGGGGTSKVVPVNAEAAVHDFRLAHPHTRLLKSQDRIVQVYGRAFGYGDTPEEVADQFRLDHAGVFGVQAAELDPRGPLADERHTQDAMYDPATGTYKFTVVYYTQYESGIPVFGADLRLLIRNEPGHPLVLANSSLRDLGAFSAHQIGPIDFDLARQSALDVVPDLINFTEPRRVIWAGVDDQVVEPTVGIEFVADNGREATGDYQKWLFLTDANTGEVLYQENQILHTDVAGNVSGMASQGKGADICEPEELEAMPYARLNLESQPDTFFYADENGDFTIDNNGDAEVTVVSPVRGLYFRVENQIGPNTVLTMDVDPPGPANFVHNQPNNDEFNRAEINAYVEANVVRDAIVQANPNYPQIGAQRDWPANVNIDSNCNAFYDGASINFFTSGGGCSNTANTTVVHHEYGHHLVRVGGSGQGQYGEGMSDVMAVILTDDPILGYGFVNDCNNGIRNADNDFQYPCSGGIHYCGQLISGCVWSTRNELVATEPDDYLDILMDLSVNSVLMHNGSNIGPDITIAWLTFDDSDDNLDNGTPHYNEINAGFGAHNMAAPELNLFLFIYADGRPLYVDPVTPAVFAVRILPLDAELDPNSPMQHVSVDGEPFVSTLLEGPLGEGDLYNVVLPAADCFATIEWYLTAETLEQLIVFNPLEAPTLPYTAVAAHAEIFAQDNFEQDQGWTVQNINLPDGSWERAVPAAGGDRGDPLTDFDGSGKCYVTDNGDGNSDVDGGPTHLISPRIDLSAAADPILTYARWFTVDEPDEDRLDVAISNDDGSSWALIERAEDGPRWIKQSVRIRDYIELTSWVRVRYSAMDSPNDSITEAGIDAFAIVELECLAVRVPTALQVVRGRVAFGVLEDMFVSDDSWMTFQPGITQDSSEPPVWLILTGSSPIDVPAELRFTLEANVDAPGVTQRIELYNYVAQEYEEVDVRVATDTDTTVEIVVDGDPSRFINSESLEMKAQLTWQPGPVVFFPWNAHIDQAVWGVVP